MNEFNGKIIDWSEQEFNVKVDSNESFNLFRGKNGGQFKKFFNFMSDTIKSKKNCETIKRFNDSINCKNELKVIGNEIQVLESKISKIVNQLIAEESKCKRIRIKDKMNQNKLFVSKLLINSIENISEKNKLCTQLKPNLMLINDTIDSFAGILFVTTSDWEQWYSFDKTLTPNDNISCDHIFEQLESIDSLISDLMQMEIIKPFKLKYDFQQLTAALFQLNPVIEVKQQVEKETEPKNSEIHSKLILVQNLIKYYEIRRSESLARLKPKFIELNKSIDQ